MLQDLKYGFRLLRQSPWFTLVSVLSLAGGLGCGVGLFVFMNALIFRPLPGHDTAKVHTVDISDSDGDLFGSVSFADFQTFTTAAPELFAATCATTRVKANLAWSAVPAAANGAVFSGGCFDTIRLRPHLGRLLNHSDDQPSGNPPPVVISYSMWVRDFNSDAGVAGKPISVNGVPAVIVGVSEPGFAGLSLDASAAFFAPPQLVPALLSEEILTGRGLRYFSMYVRLRDGVSGTQAQDRLTAIGAELRAESPRAWTQTNGQARRVTVVPELESRFGESPEEVLLIGSGFLAAIVAIAAIACINLATMMVARGASRTRELNVRLALGASRGRLLRQLATESLLIGVAGSAGGLAIGGAALKVFEVNRPVEIPAFNIGMDWRVFAFAAIMAIAAPILFGLAPGAHALRLAIVEGLKGRTVSKRRRFLRVAPREWLIVAQVATSFAMIVGAALFMESLASTTAKATTGRTVAIANVDLNTAARTDREFQAVATRILEAAARAPGVTAVTAAAVVPLTGTRMETSLQAPDAADPTEQSADVNVVAPGYLELTGVAVRAGRGFNEGDNSGAAPVVIVSEAMARRLWDRAPAVGRTVRVDDVQRTVVGVAADVQYQSLTEPARPMIYVPLTQFVRTRFWVHASVSNTGAALVALEQALHSEDARVIVSRAQMFDELMELTRMPVRFAQWIGGAAGAVQLGLALMAVWGLVAYAVQRRTTEIAIRRALGATEPGIVGLVMRPSLWLLGIGGAIGCLAGYIGANIIQSAFPEVEPMNPIVVVPTALLLVAVVVLGSWIPARRAVAIEPASALKQS